MDIPWHPSSFGAAILSATTFGLLGMLLTLLGYKIFDWLTPKIEVQKQLAENHNIAVAIVVAAVILAVAIVTAAAIMG